MKDSKKNNAPCVMNNTFVNSHATKMHEINGMRRSSSRSSSVEFENVEKLGFSHVLQPYLGRYMKDSKKATGLWIKSSA